MHKKSDLFYNFLHVPFDVIAVTLAFLVAYYLRGNGLEIYRLPIQEYWQLMYVAVPVWILIFAIQGMYTRHNLFGTLQNISHIAISDLAGWATFVVYLVFLKTEATLVFPRLMLVYILVLSFLFVFMGRLVLRFIQFVVRMIGYGRKRIVILGKGKTAEELEEKLLSHTDPSIIFVKRFESNSVDALVDQLNKTKADELIIADNDMTDTKILEYLIAAQNAGVDCHLVPNLFEVKSTNVLFSTVAGTPVMTFRQTPLEGWGRIAKRVFDVVGSSVGLIILSPIFLIVSIIVKITDPGPILYGHTRLGRDGKKFKMFKFRSMIAKYCAGPQFSGKSELELYIEMGRQDLIEEFKRDHKVKDDPRISRIGKIMRKTRIDELPQLINVFRGELSLVGPRPIVDAELEKYGRWASYLLSIKPGMTGLWQVSGGNDVTYDERVKLDAHYVQNWSLWQDMLIIVKTVLTIISSKSQGY